MLCSHEPTGAAARMIIYPRKFSGFPLLFTCAGSALPRAVVPAIIACIEAILLQIFLPHIYLEDLFVRPQFRRRGLARKLLATLARTCVDNGYTRLSWAVLDWNANAIALYDGVGGAPQSEWITYRVSGPRLSALAAESG